MRVLILTGLSLAMLAACSQKSDREGPETCACITGAMEEKLSPDLFRRTAAAIGREKRDVEDFVESLTMADQLEFASSLTAMISCELAVADDE